VREAGAKHFVDLKVGVDPRASLEEAHGITDAVETALRATFKQADVLVHAEPDGISRRGLSEEATLLSEKAGGSVHALEVHRTDGGLAVEMHLEWPAEMTLSEAHRRTTEIEERLRGSFPQVTAVSTHLECLGEPPEDRRDATAENGELARALASALSEVEGIRGFQDMRIMEGEDRLWVTLSTLLPPDTTVREAHSAATAVESRLLRVDPRIGGVNVHAEPG